MNDVTVQQHCRMTHMLRMHTNRVPFHQQQQQQQQQHQTTTTGVHSGANGTSETGVAADH